jgi:hypothetical protein
MVRQIIEIVKETRRARLRRRRNEIFDTMAARKKPDWPFLGFDDARTSENVAACARQYRHRAGGHMVFMHYTRKGGRRNVSPVCTQQSLNAKRPNRTIPEGRYFDSDTPN